VRYPPWNRNLRARRLISVRLLSRAARPRLLLSAAVALPAVVALALAGVLPGCGAGTAASRAAATSGTVPPCCAETIAIQPPACDSPLDVPIRAAAIGKAKADGSVARTVTRICRADLIVVDDIGMLPAGQDAAEAFYRITDAAYERRSVAVTSNIHPSGFDTIMPKTLATATVDRLLHHAHLVLTKGDSHRLAEALTGKGVIPLAT
jgi:hypothetical protein